MKVTVEIGTLAELRDVAGLTNDGIADGVGITGRYVASKLAAERPWYEEELPALVDVFLAAPRPVKVTLAKLRELIGNGNIRGKRWERGSA